MYRVDLYARVRRACRVDGMSVHEASRVFGLDRKTVRKMLKFSVPPGYRRRSSPRRPKLDPFIAIIDRILEEDRHCHRKQRHTAKRIFERLGDEHGFEGGYTIVKDYVRSQRLRRREMFIPLDHAPGHAQVDFGEARGGDRRGRPGRFTSLPWICRTAMRASSRPIRRRRPRRSATVTMRHSPSSTACRCRFSMTTPRSRSRASWAMAHAGARGCSPSFSRITFLPTGSAGPVRGTTRAPSTNSG